MKTQDAKHEPGHLCLNRTPGQRIRIGRDIVVEVRSVQGSRV